MRSMTPTAVNQLSSARGVRRFLLPPGIPTIRVAAFRWDGPTPEAGLYWILEHGIHFTEAFLDSGRYLPCVDDGEIGNDYELAIQIFHAAFPAFQEGLEGFGIWRGGRGNQHFVATVGGATRSFHFWFQN